MLLNTPRSAEICNPLATKAKLKKYLHYINRTTTITPPTAATADNPPTVHRLTTSPLLTTHVALPTHELLIGQHPAFVPVPTLYQRFLPTELLDEKTYRILSPLACT